MKATKDTHAQILVVDDDATLLRALSRLLRSAGYQVIKATTGQEGLRLAREKTPDLILIDVVLPDLDGPEICRRIKADAALEGSMVVLLSGIKTTSDSQAEGLEAGADEYIARPISNRELLARVRTMLRIKRTEEELRRHRDHLEELVQERVAELRAVNQQLEQEIAEHQRAQEQLDYQANLLQNVSDAIIATDLEFKVKSWNKAAETMYGWQAEEVVGKTLDSFTKTVYPHDQADQVLEQFLERGEWSGEVIQKRKDGTAINVLASVSVLEDSAGKRVGAVAVNRDITERVRTEGALRESEERFAVFMDYLPASVFVKDENSRVLYVNRYMKDFFDAESWVGQTTNEHFAAEIAKAMIADDREALAKGPLMRVESLTDHKGVERAYQTIKFPIKQKDKPPLLGGIALDITERLRAEEELQRYTERLETLREIDRAILAARSPQEIAQAALSRVRRLVPCIRAGVIGFDWEAGEAAAHAVHANGQTQLGVGRQVPIEALGKFEELEAGRPSVVPDIQALSQLSPTDRALLAEGVRAYVNVPLIAGGELLGTLNLGADEPDAFDEAHVEIARDIAAQLAIVLHQARLYDQVQRHATALERSAQELTILNTIARRASASLSLEQVVQAVLQEIVPALAPDLVLLYLREGDKLLLQGTGPSDAASHSGGTPEHRVGECLCGLAVSGAAPIYSDSIHTDPRCTWEECKKAGLCSFAALPLRSGERVIGVLGLASATECDFGQRAAFLETLADQVATGVQNARLHQEIRRHADELEQRVAERTAELQKRVGEVEHLNQAMANLLQDLQAANRKLEETGRELERMNAELEAFAYSVSHDLRAPLRAINGFAHIISERHRADLNEQGRRYFDNIVEASAQMSQLIDDLLRYSRLGRRAVRRQPVPLADVLDQLSKELAGRVAEVGAHLDLPPDLPLALGDPTLLRQIFTNLLDNALTYRRPDVPLRVTVTCQVKEDRVVVCVADNGIGIEPEFHEKIFNLFQRLHGLDEYPGTGIGLAIVKKSVELLGGQVWVESILEKGSTFCVELPVVSGD